MNSYPPRGMPLQPQRQMQQQQWQPQPQQQQQQHHQQQRYHHQQHHLQHQEPTPQQFLSEDNPDLLYSINDLTNLPEYPFFTIQQYQQSPSMRLSNMNPEKWRPVGPRYIFKVGKRLRLPLQAMGTACAYFHRYLCRVSMSAKDLYGISAACLFLASKVEECRVKLDTMVDAHFEVKEKKSLPHADPEFIAFRNKIVYEERVLLDAIEFKFEVVHPHKYCMEVVRRIFFSEHGRADRQQAATVAKEVGKAAWDYCTQSMSSTAGLFFPPQLIAITCVWMACILREVPVDIREYCSPGWIPYAFRMRKNDMMYIAELVCNVQGRNGAEAFKALIPHLQASNSLVGGGGSGGAVIGGTAVGGGVVVPGIPISVLNGIVVPPPQPPLVPMQGSVTHAHMPVQNMAPPGVPLLNLQHQPIRPIQQQQTQPLPLPLQPPVGIQRLPLIPLPSSSSSSSGLQRM